MTETDFKARTAPSGAGGTRRPPGRPKRSSGPATPRSGDLSGGPRLITLRDFYEGIMGLSRGWYNHQVERQQRGEGEPGFPRKVLIGTKPMLIEEECRSYLRRYIAARDKEGG